VAIDGLAATLATVEPPPWWRSDRRERYGPAVPNPFVYGRPLKPDALIDRETELALLVDLADGGHPVRLSAPRRYGKTSLLGALAQEWDRGFGPAIRVSFSGLLSAEDAAARLERACRHLRSPMRAWLVGALEALRPTVAVPGTGVELAARPIASPEIAARLVALLDLPARLAARSEQRPLVIFDEFQEVLAAPAPLDGLIRSVIEHHAGTVSYVFAGSHPGMMRALFADRERPFYGQARAVSLPALPLPELGDAIQSLMLAERRDAGDALGPLLRVTRGHPQRAMQVAHHLYDRLTPGASGSELELAAALAAAEDEARDALDALWRGLDDAERRALAAMLDDPQRALRAEALARFGVARSTARDALERLRQAGHLELDAERRAFVVDPLLERWIQAGREELR